MSRHTCIHTFRSSSGFFKKQCLVSRSFLHDSISALANLSKKLYSGSTGSFCNSFYGPFFFLLSVDHSVYPASQIFISPSVSDFIVSQHLVNNCLENTDTVNLICALLYFSNNISEHVSENTKVYLQCLTFIQPGPYDSIDSKIPVKWLRRMLGYSEMQNTLITVICLFC